MISIDEFDKTIPVNPPIVNKNTNPIAHIIEIDKLLEGEPCIVAIHLKILIPVGIAMIIVAEVK